MTKRNNIEKPDTILLEDCKRGVQLINYSDPNEIDQQKSSITNRIRDRRHKGHFTFNLCCRK